MTTTSAKTVLITGASTGFSRDTAEFLASKDHRAINRRSSIRSARGTTKKTTTA